MYVTTATAILPLLPNLPQTNTSAGYSATVSKVQLHITRAEALINSKISSRYSISQFTTTSIPPILKMITEDITSYYTLRSFYTGDNQNITEWIIKYEDSIAILDQIRNGEADIVGADDSLIGQSTTGGSIDSSTEDYEPTFNEGDPVNWYVDTNK